MERKLYFDLKDCTRHQKHLSQIAFTADAFHFFIVVICWSTIKEEILAPLCKLYGNH